MVDLQIRVHQNILSRLICAKTQSASLSKRAAKKLTNHDLFSEIFTFSRKKILADNHYCKQRSGEILEVIFLVHDPDIGQDELQHA